MRIASYCAGALLLSQLIFEMAYAADVQALPSVPLLGQGINTVSGTVADASCLESGDPVFIPGIHVVNELHVATTASELMQSLGVDANVSLGYSIYSAKANYSAFTVSASNSYNVYLVARVEVTTGAKHIDPNASLTFWRPWTSSGATDIFRRCGNYFVDLWQLGGSFYMVAVYSASTTSDHDSLKASLSAAAIGYGNGNIAEAKSRLASVSQQLLDIKYAYHGSKQAPPSGGAIDQNLLTQYIDYARNFQNNIVPLGQNAEPYDYSWVSWSTKFAKADLALTQGLAVTALARAKLTVTSQIADIEYVRDHSTEFPSSDQAIVARLPEAHTVLDQIDDMITKCTAYPADGWQCASFAEIPTFGIVIPARTQWNLIDVRTPEFSPIGRIPAGEMRTVRVQGDWYTHCDQISPPIGCIQPSRPVVGHSMYRFVQDNGATNYGEITPENNGAIKFLGPGIVGVKVHDGNERDGYGDNYGINTYGALY